VREPRESAHTPTRRARTLYVQAPAIGAAVYGATVRYTAGAAAHRPG